jgi:hypothetical protein
MTILKHNMWGVKKKNFPQTPTFIQRGEKGEIPHDCLEKFFLRVRTAQ